MHIYVDNLTLWLCTFFGRFIMYEFVSKCIKTVLYNLNITIRLYKLKGYYSWSLCLMCRGAPIHTQAKA